MGRAGSRRIMFVGRVSNSKFPYHREILTLSLAFGGMLGPMIKMVVGAQLIDRFGDYSRDLRQYFETRKKSVQNGRARDAS